MVVFSHSARAAAAGIIPTVRHRPLHRRSDGVLDSGPRTMER
jgi:hypothetical protein